MESLRNRGGNVARLPETLQRSLIEQGRTRALLYKVLVATALRYSELKSIRCSQVILDGDHPHIELKAADSKGRRAARVPVPVALVDDLAEYLTRRRSRDTGHPRRSNVLSFKKGDKKDDPKLFNMPGSMLRTFEKDLLFAGLATRDSETGHIERKDIQGRSLDIHCLRGTCATWLARAGVPLQVTQRTLRHQDPKTTARYYTFLDMGDVAEAVSMLPALDGPAADVRMVATGKPLPNVAQNVALAGGKSIQNSANSCKSDIGKQDGDRPHTYEQKRPDSLGNRAFLGKIEGEKAGSGAGIRTPDTWIMIPLL